MDSFADSVGFKVPGIPCSASQILPRSKLFDTQLEVLSPWMLFCVLSQENEQGLAPGSVEKTFG
jgi:hypothetical protein